MNKYGQSRCMAAIEALINIGSGMIIAFSISQLAAHYEPEIQTYIYTDFEWKIGFKANLIMTTVFTGTSMIRSFIWRRVFNKLHIKHIKRTLTDEQ